MAEFAAGDGRLITLFEGQRNMRNTYNLRCKMATSSSHMSSPTDSIYICNSLVLIPTVGSPSEGPSSNVEKERWPLTLLSTLSPYIQIVEFQYNLQLNDGFSWPRLVHVGNKFFECLLEKGTAEQVKLIDSHYVFTRLAIDCPQSSRVAASSLCLKV